MDQIDHPDLEQLERDLADIASALAAEDHEVSAVECCYSVDRGHVSPRIYWPDSACGPANRMLEALGWTLPPPEEPAYFCLHGHPHETAHDRMLAIRRITEAMASAALEHADD